MGSGAGGYVRITLQTLLSFYDEKAKRLHRISRLAFTGAPIPTLTPPKDIDTAPPGLPAGRPLVALDRAIARAIIRRSIK